jgi:hypothetical protein
MFNKKGSSQKDEGKSVDPKDAAFQNAWFSMSDPKSSPAATAQKTMSPAQRNLEDIKKYAYDAFDQIDANGNGFIETSELNAVLADPDTPMRDKSFVMFLLSNQQDIANAVQEGTPEHRDGISRLDIEQYFKIVISRIG